MRARPNMVRASYRRSMLMAFALAATTQFGVASEAPERVVVAIPHSSMKFALRRIPQGEFNMGSPPAETTRKNDEGPVRRVRLDAFYMGECEVTWNEFDQFLYRLDRKQRPAAVTERDQAADAVTHPTAPYVEPTWGFGHDGYPVHCMTQHAAKRYCDWLTALTGDYYRLPTEAEWEYACRAGSETAWSSGNTPQELDDIAWYAKFCAREGLNDQDYGPRPVKRKLPNAWGLYDMHGNVAEWCQDRYAADFYGRSDVDAAAVNPLNIATTEYPRVVRGGSWMDDADRLRSAARDFSVPEWKQQDPCVPQSVWYLTDAQHVGFRVVRPLRRPAEEEIRDKRLGGILPDDARDMFLREPPAPRK